MKENLFKIQILGFCLDFGNNEKIQGKSDKKGHEFLLFLVSVENGKENRIRWKIIVILVWNSYFSN